jgi:uncharacterized protein (DUF1800 family)
MAIDFWAPYTPSDQEPWNLRRVVHLHRRAALAGTWDELQRDLAEGPTPAIKRLLTGASSLHPPAAYEATASLLTDAAVSQGEIGRLKAAWFYRFLYTPDPLLEKLTLVWHDHFATANAKVDDVGLMRRQNDTLRTHARGRFAGLLNAAVREPALLLYLDAQTNRKGRANENLGRELLELFTLGVGHYTEADVKEAARALTGWTVEDGEFAENGERHDAGEKTILGRKGPWTGANLIDLLLEQPATAEHIARKLCRQFVGNSGVPAEAMQQLTDGLRQHDLNISWALERILASQLFFADANLGNRVLCPVEFVVGSARVLELFDPAPSTLAMADWSARMGQDLYEPPNVGGWPGGKAWMHTRGLIARANYAAALVSGPHSGRALAYDPAALAGKYGFGSKGTDLLVFHCRLLFGTDPPEAMRKLQTLEPAKMVTALLSSPEAQLG